MGETQAPETPDETDPIVVRTPVHQQENPDEERFQIMKGEVALKVTILRGKRLSKDTLENLEADVQAIFKRARRERQAVGEKFLAVGEQIQKKVEGQPDDNIAKAVNCGVDNHLWSTSVV